MTTAIAIPAIPKRLVSFVALGLLCLAIVALPVSANALSLDQAKAQGLVGERQNGYLGVVSKPAKPEVKALVADINGKRKAKYQAIASKNGTALNAVEALAGKKAISKTSSGHYIQLSGGQWQKK